MKLNVACLLSLFLFFSLPGRGAGKALDPAHTWVFAAGLVEWQDNALAKFSQADRSDDTVGWGI